MQLKKLIATLLSLALVFSLFAAMPIAVFSANEPFQVTENPIGATYALDDAAVPLKAVFEYNAGKPGYIDHQTPIKVRWYLSNENSNTDRSNGFTEMTVEYGRQITYATTKMPATNIAGV